MTTIRGSCIRWFFLLNSCWSSRIPPQVPSFEFQANKSTLDFSACQVNEKQAVELRELKLFYMVIANLILNILLVSEFFSVVWKSVNTLINSRGPLLLISWRLIFASNGAGNVIRSTEWYDQVNENQTTEWRAECRFRLWLRRILSNANYISGTGSKIRSVYSIRVVDSRHRSRLVLVLLYAVS